MKGFLYGQTEYNLLNNSIHLKDYIQLAKTHSFTFLSMTDKNLYGSYKFHQECIANHIKPIIGIEITYMDDDGFKSKLLAYALNDDGYKNLLKISTYLATHDEPYGLEFLEPYRNNIAFISVYNESIIERLHYSKAFEELNLKLEQLNSYFDYYVGYSFTNRLDRLNSNQEICSIIKKLGMKIIPLHNCRYLNNKDKIIYEALTQIEGNAVEVKEYEDYSFDMDPIFTEELESFVNQVHLNLYPKKIYLPAYPNTKGAKAIDYLKTLCSKGLYRRLKGKITSVYQERLNYELSIIEKMGYSDYFLIVWDFILYAKKKGILVGPGRGSGAGSLVAYCLGITEIDPLEYDLLFERFLNPERISMPDIDTDFPDTSRDDVIQYVNELYGAKHVCNISAFNTFQIKSSIRDLGRIRKIDNARLNEIIRMVEANPNYDALLDQFVNRQDIYEFLYIIRGLDGLPRHISTHAAGVIISSTELDDIIPLQEGINGLYQSQLEASDLEKIGLLKMDFLGIRNLTIIDEVMKNIQGFTMTELRNIPLNDKKTYQLLQSADTLGVFQLESDGIRRVLNKLKPERFDDLVAVLALYRPGPMENIDEFIARRHGKKFTYEHPVLEPILKSTYGIIVYQEQIMQIAQTFAGFTLGQADLLRRAISKKKESELLNQEVAFIQGAMKKGHSEAVAKHIYEYFLKFNNYGFNKSHAVAYGLVSYQMAYLKANYFNIFISKILNNVIGATKTMVSYINYAKAHKVITYKPNVNISTNQFEVKQAGMFMPLQAIHSIGEVTALEIVRKRNENGLFKSFQDFKERTKLSESALEALIYAGALDGFGLTKKQMIEAKSSINEIIARHLEDRIEDTSEYDFKTLQQKEFMYLGFNLTYDIFLDLPKLQKKYQANYLSRKTGRCIGCFEFLKEILTKKQEPMLVGEFTDGQSVLSFVIFPQEYKRKSFEIETNRLYLIEYTMRMDEKKKQNQLIIKNVIEC
ncbi:MAG: DNA polymerase III subunit alpha [Roseburia sp.]|nr:DNA polymerase III subunit alpha [Anaeroplasma bactoclasticum]MCM1195994.1 DNA polymerase III subunit alpha [Roseburia sp.]MCM1556824.1 DNA polymerase III subunit alpha [Anaeroplasma bactoclasticum]